MSQLRHFYNHTSHCLLGPPVPHKGCRFQNTSINLHIPSWDNFWKKHIPCWVILQTFLERFGDNSKIKKMTKLLVRTRSTEQAILGHFLWYIPLESPWSPDSKYVPLKKMSQQDVPTRFLQHFQELVGTRCPHNYHWLLTQLE